jgi:drug/metabolite transporter (DMT)-like permease
MTFSNLALIISCVIGISIGQILFKLASASMPTEFGVGAVVQLAVNRHLIGALIIYAAATLGWVYSLRVVPLTIAYPFMALAFVIVPVLSAFFLQESISIRLAVGTALIVCGIAAIVSK